MSVKVNWGKYPARDYAGLIVRYPEDQTREEYMDDFIEFTLDGLKRVGTIPKDALPEDIFPITIEMPCCGKIHQIDKPEDFPEKSLECCQYGYFVKVITLPGSIPKKKEAP